MEDRLDKNSRKKYNKKPELLAPAGSFTALKAVIHAGADAIYLGGSRFGARAYAENFTQEELLEAIDYAHLHGRKLFLAVNTLLKQPEMDALYGYLLPYYEQGVDAAIVQDFGVMQFIRSHFPDLPIHISTQMSVMGAYGASYLKKQGAVRVIPARELSLAEIRAVRSQSDIEIECFVHGALCYCYSGQCLLSSMLGGRSGNRGRCAQPCRLPYTAFDADGRRLSEPESYLLSLKDLSTLGQIPELIEAGIDSFKIEGRMKSAEYAAGVTALYRKYIDRYMEHGAAAVQEQDYSRLLETGNRSGFTDGYYHKRHGPDMVTMARPGHEKSEGEYLSSVRERYVGQERKLQIQAEADFKIGEPAVISVTCGGVSVAASHGITEAAKKQPLSQDMIAAQLSKTGNTPFYMEALSVRTDGQVFLPKQALNCLRRKALDSLAAQMLARYRRTAQDLAEDNSHVVHPDHAPGSGHGNTWQSTWPAHAPGNGNAWQKADPGAGLGDLADTAHTTPHFTAAAEEEAQILAILGQESITRIYLSSSMYTHRHFAAQLKEHVSRIKAAGKQAYLILPPIFRMETAQFYKERWQEIIQSGVDGFLAQNQDELGFLDGMQAEKGRCVLGHSLYTYSDSTKACYAAIGWKYDTVPLELNRKELLARDNTASELIIYGHMPLMVSAQCIYKTSGQCKRTGRLCCLKDRYAKKFPVRTDCSECYNTIYNPQPLSLIQLSGELGRLRPAAYRLHFTSETKEQTSRILRCYEQSFLGHKVPDMAGVIGAYTNGHYKRGVE